MKKSTPKSAVASFSPSEKNSEKLLMDKMGLSQRELKEVRLRYGVSASQLLEIMSLSKYQFVFTGKTPGQCEPCYHLGSSPCGY